MLLNFLPISSGGGLQNSLSFLQCLAKEPKHVRNTLAIVRQSSAVHRICLEYELPNLAVEATTVGRFRFEAACRRMFESKKVCLTLFGPPMLRGSKYFVNVIGCAYSNLFYPEIPFWCHHSVVYRWKKNLIDSYRRIMVQNADFWIFETPTLASRALRLGFPADRVSVVRMAPSSLVHPRLIQEERVTEFARMLPLGFKVLLISGAQPNKRLHKLPAIAAWLKKRGNGEIHFVITAPADHEYTKQVMASFAALGVANAVTNVGPVAPDIVASLISCCDAMATLSVLESFSNNFVEAWRMGKPLLVTDADWARDACADAALYVDPDDPGQCGEVLCRLRSDAKLQRAMASAGERQLLGLPSSEEKNRQYFQCIAAASELGPCSQQERKNIRWS